MEEKIIRTILKDLKIPTCMIGFKYALFVVKKILYEENYNITDIYKIVAGEHKTTGSKVEHAIRYINNNCNANEYFGVKYKIANKEFLELIKEKTNEIMLDVKQ